MSKKKKQLEELSNLAREAREKGVPIEALMGEQQACYREASQSQFHSQGGKVDKADKMLKCTKDKWKKLIEEQED